MHVNYYFHVTYSEFFKNVIMQLSHFTVKNLILHFGLVYIIGT